ncbi:MAG: hypothetical protein WEF86_11600 [Gemmatimonadota bacterium]
MDDEMRAVLREMRTESQAAFGRIDRYFELNQLQIAALRTELRTELREGLTGLRIELGDEIRGLRSELGGEIQGLRSELRSFRDWTEASFARVWVELRGLRAWAEPQFANVRADIQRLDEERRW